MTRGRSSGFMERLLSPKMHSRIFDFVEETEKAVETVRVTCSNILEIADDDTLAEYRTIFDVLDDDLSESITETELFAAFSDMGIDMEREELHSMVLEIDEDADGEINFLEFSVMLFNLSNGKFSPRRRTGNVLDSEAKTIGWLEDQFPRIAALREQMWKTFEDPSSSWFASFLSIFLMSLIVISVLFFILETLPELYKNPDFEAISGTVEIICIIFFTLEYVLRLCCSPNIKGFLLDAMNFVDFIAILPFYVEAFESMFSDGEKDTDASGSAAIRVVRLFRVFRIFKISRYLTWITVFTNSLSESFSPLMMVLFMIVLAMVFSSSIIYFTEVGQATWEGTRYVNNDGEVSKFESIPAAFWWCIITMTTIGYGDIVPKTTAGMVISMATSLLGVIVLALPISIISANFRSEYLKLLNQKATAAKQKTKLREAQKLVDAEEDLSSEGGQTENDNSERRPVVSVCCRRQETLYLLL